MSELVTGEAVALGLQPAKLPSRALSVALDLIVYMGGYIVIMIGLVAATSSLDTAAAAAVSVASLLLILIGVPIAVETLTRGRSLGKLACGLRVVRDDGGPIRFRHALVRGVVGVFEIQMSFGVIACIASLVSARGRRLGDVFAGTLVVRERVPVQRAWDVLPTPPPWLAGPLAGADLSGVPEGLWLAVRQYLTRIQQLDPQVGWAMGERLAADVAARAAVTVPPGTPPAAFLAAIVAERQARDAQRAFGAPQSVVPFAAVAPPAAGAGAGPAVEPVLPAERPSARGTGFAPPA
ncbi:RDD family protein [Actinacidiphila oryziradicis]|uniref:RDD family protein n=1 Tax=Actinacidiphila oryziradicis TaxID=2571141 RepID=A0A4U0SM20_9ACTN|nr:RDD family protein [Actinacidiphila oryziradicis]TKA10108.1 RDD family protein [Actinacidiphila oryziradicis]